MPNVPSTTHHSIHASGNLHIDSATSGYIYLNYYSGKSVIIGNLTFHNSSITDSSGTISFNNNNLSTTGTLGAGVATLASGTSIGNLTLADGSITDSSGNISFGNENLSTTGTFGIRATNPNQALQVGDNGSPQYIQVGANNYTNTWISAGNSSIPHIFTGSGPDGMSNTPDTATHGFGWQYDTGGDYHLLRKNGSTSYDNVMSINRNTGNIDCTGTINADNNNNSSFIANSADNSAYTISIGGWYSASHPTEHRITASANLHIDSADNGNLYLNNYSNNNVLLGDSPDDTVRLGIGCNPTYPIHITTTSGTPGLFNHNGPGASTHNYLRNGYEFNGNQGAMAAGGLNVQIYCQDGSFLTNNGVVTISDSRIKKNIIELVDNEALIKFRQLKPCKYNYIDTINRSNVEVYGFIAQEVKEVLQYAVSILPNNECIPNIYKGGVYNNNIITFDTVHNLDSDGTIKLFLHNNKKIIVPYTIIDTLKINIDISELSDKEKPSNNLVQDDDGNDLQYNIFVYGTEVDDFHTLNKDAIWTTASAALQEVDRIQQANGIKITNLENELAAEKIKVSLLETQLADVLSRLSALENN